MTNVALGLAILIYGVTLVRRARKQRLEEPVDLSAIPSTPSEA